MKAHSSPAAVLNGGPHDQPEAASVQQVAPVHYHHLRMLAECAAGLEQDADFTFTREGSLEVTTEPRDDRVLVPARGRGKYPRNVIRLHTAPAVPGGSVEELRLEPGTADAVFWSDSAVHKFVVPYVASCACHDAPHALGMLLSAWNYYPTDKVTVHALAHVLKDGDGIPLGMQNRIHVVYAERQNGKEGTSLARLPLVDFVKAYPPPQDPSSAVSPENSAVQRNGAGSAHDQVPYRRGGKSARSQRPDYTTLRALAEHACALATEPQYFLFKAGEHGFRQKTTTGMPALEPGDIVIPAYTPTVPPLRPRLDGVWCDSEDGHTANIAHGSDAMFWSDGAVEQFMFPYYASKGGLHLGLRELQEMAALWSGPHAAGEEQLRDDQEQACQEKLRACEEKLRACEERLRAAASGAAEIDSSPTAPWTPPVVEGGYQPGDTVVEESAVWALVHLSTSVYIGESESGALWTPTWENSAGTQPSATTTYLSPRRDVGVLSSHRGKARVFRAGELMARRPA
jgi:hypothetical protein